MPILLNGQKIEYTIFPNKETRLDLPTELLRDKNTLTWKFTDNSEFFQLAQIASVLRELKADYTLFIPYLPYSRMDRVEKSNTSFSLEVLANLIARIVDLERTEVVLADTHSPKSLEIFKEQGLNARELDFSLAKQVIQEKHKNNWVVFPDKGAAQRYNAEDYDNVIVCHKERDFATGKIIGINAEILKQTSKLNENADIYIIDDICSYGGTFVGCVEAIATIGVPVKNKYLVVTHSENSILKGKILETFDKIFTTDSLITELPEKIEISELTKNIF